MYHCKINLDQIDKNIIYSHKNNRKKRKILYRDLSGNAKWYYNEIKKDYYKPKKLEKKENKKIKADLKTALNILNNIFTINKNVKKNAYKKHDIEFCQHCGEYFKNCECFFPSFEYTEVDYTLRDKEYSIKTMLIITVIKMIQDNHLPIKYGANDGVVYFEYCGKQVSFHDPKNIVHCKHFAGEWSGRKNKGIPYPFAKK